MHLDHKKERIMAIDLLRGYFLFVIAIDHLMRFPGFFDIFTGRGALWVSAAEGFFFVSGMMVGLVRGRKMLDKPMSEITKKLLSRSLKLYLWAIGLTILFTLVGIAAINNPHLKGGVIADHNIWHIIWQTATFQYAYGWSDFLQYYAIYLALSPIVIWLLRKRLWIVVIVGSILIWLVRADNIYMAWQILFFSGTIIGFYLRDIEQVARRLSRGWRHTILIAMSVLTIITFAISATVVHGESFDFLMPWHSYIHYLKDLATPYFIRSGMHLPRIALFGLWFATSYSLLRKYEQAIVEKVGGFFIPLGQNSLYVYIMQALIIFFLDLVTPIRSGLLINIITNATVVGLIWLMVKKRFLFSIVPR